MTSGKLHFQSIQRTKEYFFDIEETPVLYLDPIKKDIYRDYPDKKIIINNNLNKGISIVKNGFLLVRHEEAFNLGINIFEILFGVTPQIHNECLNSKTTDYNVDLISEKCKIVFDSRGYRFFDGRNNNLIDNFRRDDIRNINEIPLRNRNIIAENFYDDYFPFIRVSNYLREGNSFYIEMGYYRYRCSNGMMLGRKTKMTFKHSYFVSNFKIIKEAAVDQFLRYKKRFLNMADKLWYLLSIHVPKAQMRLVSFDIFEKELIKKSVSERKRLQIVLSDLIDKYVIEIGENLNAALNVATEFSKLLEGKRVSQSNIQNLSSIWISRVTKKTFNIEKYFKEINDIEDRVLSAKEVVEEEEEFEY
jgi:hypothetical protein